MNNVQFDGCIGSSRIIGRKRQELCYLPVKPVPTRNMEHILAMRDYGMKLVSVFMQSCYKLVSESFQVELGASDEAMQIYNTFMTTHEELHPERTKPAPKRRRGESSSDWLSVCGAHLSEQCSFVTDLVRIHSAGKVGSIIPLNG